MKRSPMKPRTTRIKPRNAKRRAREFERAYGGDERVAWVAARPCCACHRAPPSENAHTANGGTSRKADADTIVPLCTTCHRLLHRVGAQSFEARYGLSLATQAQLTEMAYQRYLLEEAA